MTSGFSGRLERHTITEVSNRGCDSSSFDHQVWSFSTELRATAEAMRQKEKVHGKRACERSWTTNMIFRKHTHFRNGSGFWMCCAFHVGTDWQHFIVLKTGPFRWLGWDHCWCSSLRVCRRTSKEFHLCVEMQQVSDRYWCWSLDWRKYELWTDSAALAYDGLGSGPYQFHHSAPRSDWNCWQVKVRILSLCIWQLAWSVCSFHAILYVHLGKLDMSTTKKYWMRQCCSRALVAVVPECNTEKVFSRQKRVFCGVPPNDPEMRQKQKWGKSRDSPWVRRMFRGYPQHQLFETENNVHTNALILWKVENELVLKKPEL